MLSTGKERRALADPVAWPPDGPRELKDSHKNDRGRGAAVGARRRCAPPPNAGASCAPRPATSVPAAPPTSQHRPQADTAPPNGLPPIGRHASHTDDASEWRREWRQSDSLDASAFTGDATDVRLSRAPAGVCSCDRDRAPPRSHAPRRARRSVSCGVVRRAAEGLWQVAVPYSCCVAACRDNRLSMEDSRTRARCDARGCPGTRCCGRLALARPNATTVTSNGDPSVRLILPARSASVSGRITPWPS